MVWEMLCASWILWCPVLNTWGEGDIWLKICGEEVSLWESFSSKRKPQSWNLTLLKVETPSSIRRCSKLQHTKFQIYLTLLPFLWNWKKKTLKSVRIPYRSQTQEVVVVPAVIKIPRGVEPEGLWVKASLGYVIRPPFKKKWTEKCPGLCQHSQASGSQRNSWSRPAMAEGAGAAAEGLTSESTRAADSSGAGSLVNPPSLSPGGWPAVHPSHSEAALELWRVQHPPGLLGRSGHQTRPWSRKWIILCHHIWTNKNGILQWTRRTSYEMGLGRA